MDIKVKVKETKNIKLDKETINKVCIARLCEIYSWEEDYYIKDNKVMVEIEHHTSHTWYEEVEIREATDEDYMVFKLIQKIRTYK